MAADSVIADVRIMPNPVYVRKQFIISVGFKDSIPVLGDENIRMTDEDGSFLLAPFQEVHALADEDDALMIDERGEIIEVIKEDF